ncbi:DUF7504 family protein [Halocalculus aciditolerans]|uniref:Uncharacterized protein n=1 Tax=Halocalculus aciditolerans TaxID=1383812 RepID=A0A830FBI4_9EURY|nr:hypothetical protein [Halocalculus aciditolerans]GGL73268.1 hypothetical protein GCM10009039_34220 [Halocalculus aciditolerans]
MTEDYAFDDLPLDAIRAGTTVLVTGPTHGGAREVALRMLNGADDEATIVVTTNQRASRIASDAERVGIRVSEETAAIIDCVGDDDNGVPARLLTVSGPSDLTGIGMRFSDVYRDFQGTGIERVRTGLFSVSTLLTFSDLKTVSRFVHTLAGRVDAVDGLGVLLVDPANHDERAVSTLAQLCNGQVAVRDGESGIELRASLTGHGREWRSVDSV